MFPCMACNFSVSTSQEQRDHYKSDWHRYNLKRKVAGLPPITKADFISKSELFTKQEGKAAEDRNELSHCPVCHKKFSSAKALENHKSSRRHLQRMMAGEQQQQQRQARQTDWIDVDADENSSTSSDSPVALEECLFCSHLADSLHANCAHMLRHHGFMLPDVDFLNDIEGLLTFLGYKVGVGFECLSCHETRQFESLRSVQKHMLDKGHCRYDLKGDHALDLAEFYDFGDVAEDNQDEEEDEEENEEPTDEEAFELVLPSGAVLGHRSLVRYFRQHPPPQRQVATRATSTASLLAQYRALGWQGPVRTQAESAALRDRAFVQRKAQRLRTRLSTKANLLQHRFRSQNPI